MPVWSPPQATDIDKKLRDDFRRLLREYGITTQETDPVLAVLFRSLATHVEAVYQQAAESIPRAVLDELIAGLGLPERAARPAQTVVHVGLQAGRERLAQGTELIGEAASKEKLTFALDSELEVSPACISLLAIYQKGSLRLHNGTELSKEFEAARPSFEAVPADLGPHPAIFMAIDVPDERHPSQHGFFFEVTPDAKGLMAHLQREVWCLLDEQSAIRAEGLLRPRPGNAGVRQLEWVVNAGPSAESPGALLPKGFYSGRVFILPEIPPERCFLTNLPKGMEAPLRQLFQAPGAGLFTHPRAWLRIALPPEVRSLAEDLISIALHCTTASIVEVLDQTIGFDQVGTSIPVSNGGGRTRHLVRPLSIIGEHGSAYAFAPDFTAEAQTGRFRIHQGRLECEPACTTDGLQDRYANVRLLLSSGALGNGVGVRALTTFLRGAAVPGLTISKAFEPKIGAVHCQPALERTPTGLCRVHKVTIVLDRKRFTAADEEATLLQQMLQAHLQERAVLGLVVRVEIVWSED